MLIALDFDETFTADEDFWLRFISLAKSHGHTVVCCTYRHESAADRKDLRTATGLPIYFCNHRAKREVMEEQGVKVDIWIDDWPELIGNGE